MKTVGDTICKHRVLSGVFFNFVYEYGLSFIQSQVRSIDACRIRIQIRTHICKEQTETDHVVIHGTHGRTAGGFLCCGVPKFLAILHMSQAFASML